MQVTVENSGGLQRRLTVQLPAGEVQGKIDQRLREIGKTAKLKGFRPGRIPMNILKQRYGPSVRNEVMSQTMQSSLYEAIQQESLKPAGNPVIEDMPKLDGSGDFQFIATIEVLPEIETIDAGTIELTPPETEITDADVDEMLNTLREQRMSWEEVDRKPQEGDQVLFEYAAETSEARYPEDGMTLLAVAMGQSGFDDLEAALAKLVAGGVDEVELEFPENFSEGGLAGQKAKTSLKVDKVREPKLPELDETFIQSFGIESGDVEEMRQEVRNNLERELSSARLSVLKTQLVRSLLDSHPDLEVPSAMVDNEASQLQAAAAQNQGQGGEAPPVDQFRELAQRRVKAGLIISEIARQNDILADGARVRQAIETVASTYEQSQEVVQMYYNNPELMQSIESNVLEEQVVDWALDNAKVNAEPMAFKDLINAAAEARQGL